MYGIAFMEQAGVPSIRFHDLRHTHATLLLSMGMNIKVVSERLGHSSTRMTLDTYSHATSICRKRRRTRSIIFSLNPSAGGFVTKMSPSEPSRPHGRLHNYTKKKKEPLRSKDSQLLKQDAVGGI